MGSGTVSFSGINLLPAKHGLDFGVHLRKINASGGLAVSLAERITMNPSYKVTAFLFGIGVTLHNLEEAMCLVSWARSHVTLWFEPNPKIYWVVTSLVSVVIWVPIVGVCVSPKNSHFQSVLSGFALVMAINAVLPHLVISLVKHSYSPGTATGMLFNLPLGILLIHGQLSAHAISPAEVWREAVLYALLLAVGAFAILYGAHAILAARKA
jgi:hypothetical protein